MDFLEFIAEGGSNSVRSAETVDFIVNVGFWLIFIALYIYFALAFQMMAKKSGTPHGWLAWLPIANVVLMLNIAQKPLWWFLLLFIPLVNIVVYIMMFMAIAKRVNKPEWVGALMVVPVLQLVVPGYLGFSKK